MTQIFTAAASAVPLITRVMAMYPENRYSTAFSPHVSSHFTKSCTFFSAPSPNAQEATAKAR